MGQPEFDAYLTRELELAIDTVSARGAHVVLLTAPYTRRAKRPDGGLWPEDEPERVDAWNRLQQAVAARRSGRVSVVDLNRRVCPEGRFTSNAGNIRIRSDGLHPPRSAGLDRTLADSAAHQARHRGAGLTASPADRPELRPQAGRCEPAEELRVGRLGVRRLDCETLGQP
ncbi:hypothetical protein BDK92_7510 [Micromonospora pisi]|uniref:GDSL-like lipase/acylhydrolase family protein n=1 Tax=Micromonospora pisi TaxID=589240 RepID=A0A495JVN6_9ACTN|nr:hypothetical protein BDK92_7510 [Micromonospora pisi]